MVENGELMLKLSINGRAFSKAWPLEQPWNSLAQGLLVLVLMSTFLYQNMALKGKAAGRSPRNFQETWRTVGPSMVP